MNPKYSATLAMALITLSFNALSAKMPANAIDLKIDGSPANWTEYFASVAEKQADGTTCYTEKTFSGSTFYAYAGACTQNPKSFDFTPINDKVSGFIITSTDPDFKPEGTSPVRACTGTLALKRIQSFYVVDTKETSLSNCSITTIKSTH